LSILPAIDVVSIWCNRETAAATEPQFKNRNLYQSFLMLIDSNLVKLILNTVPFSFWFASRNRAVTSRVLHNHWPSYSWRSLWRLWIWKVTVRCRFTSVLAAANSTTQDPVLILQLPGTLLSLPASAAVAAAGDEWNYSCHSFIALTMLSALHSSPESASLLTYPKLCHLSICWNSWIFLILFILVCFHTITITNKT